MSKYKWVTTSQLATRHMASHWLADSDPRLYVGLACTVACSVICCNILEDINTYNDNKMAKTEVELDEVSTTQIGSKII